MPRITLENALRYLLPGLVFLACAYYYDDSIANESIQKLAVLVLVSLVVGVAIFSFYRPVLYDHVVAPLLDFLNRRRKRNYRIWIQERYGIEEAREAEILYAAALRPIFPDLNSEVIKQPSALIHFTYQAFFICFTFSVISLFTRTPAISLGFFVVSILFLSAAILNDLRLDAQVYLTLDGAKAKCDKAAGNRGYKTKPKIAS
jgi:hypothetical protein